GLYLGFSGVGRYYVALGVFFLVMQGLMRYWLLPMMFKRQFVRYQFGKSEQGIDLYQDYFELYAAGRKQAVQYSEVQTFAKGKLTYMLELKNKTVIIVPKRAFAQASDQIIFENTFKK
ncbi:YcxB family protein, partial [Acinetobacter baumannii]